MGEFSPRRFLALPGEQQHKKCAEVLRRLYDSLLENQATESWGFYVQLQTWMEIEPLKSCKLKDVADRYHWHLEKARQHLKEHRLLPSVRRGDRQQGEAKLSVVVFLDHLRSAHNVGSIIRTAEAFAFQEVIGTEDTPNGEHPQVRKTSMGASEWMVCRSRRRLAELPRPIVALETSPEAVSWANFVFPEAFTLVVGNEEYGCSDEALSLADFVVEIPLYGRKNSLNVANAFAIVAAEIRRQHSLRGHQEPAVL